MSERKYTAAWTHGENDRRIYANLLRAISRSRGTFSATAEITDPQLRQMAAKHIEKHAAAMAELHQSLTAEPVSKHPINPMAIMNLVFCAAFLTTTTK